MNKFFYIGYWIGDFHAQILGTGISILYRSTNIYRLHILYLNVLEVGYSIVHNSKLRVFGVKIF